jgi:hypothetical protein
VSICGGNVGVLYYDGGRRVSTSILTPPPTPGKSDPKERISLLLNIELILSLAKKKIQLELLRSRNANLFISPLILLHFFVFL